MPRSTFAAKVSAVAPSPIDQRSFESAQMRRMPVMPFGAPSHTVTANDTL